MGKPDRNRSSCAVAFAIRIAEERKAEIEKAKTHFPAGPLKRHQGGFLDFPRESSLKANLL